MRWLLLLAASVATAQVPPQPPLLIAPSAGATGVPLNARIVAGVFTYPMLQSPIKLTKAGAAVAGTIQSANAPGGAYFVFTPSKALDPGAVYTVEVSASSVTPLAATFTTGTVVDTTPLQLLSSEPLAGQDAVSTTDPLKARFNKPVSPTSIDTNAIQIVDLGFGSPIYGVRPELQPDGVTLFVRGDLVLGHAYQLQIANLTDWLGNPLSPTPAPILFSTFGTVDRGGPRLSGSAPADGESGVPINSSVVLAFDRPLSALPLATAVSIDANGPVKFTLDTLNNRQALVIKPSLLLPANTQVTVRLSSAFDNFGAPLGAPVVVSFRTGAAPETRVLQAVPATGSTTPFPPGAPFRVFFNRPVDPLLLGLSKATLRTADYTRTAPAPYELSSDGRTMLIGGGAALPAGAYSMSINSLFDRTQGKTVDFGFSFLVGGSADSTAPQVLAVNPPDGAPDAPSTSILEVAFSETVTQANAVATGIQLFRDGTPVAGSFRPSGTVAFFSPSAPLARSTTYQVRVADLADPAGNGIAPFTWSFTTAADNPTGAFKVVSSDPPLNATNVDPLAPVVLTFNRAVNPASGLEPYNLQLYVGNGNNQPPGSWQANGNTWTFTPTAPLLQGRYFLSASRVTDVGGSAAPSFSSAFTTSAAPPDTIGPTVVSITPGDGEFVVPQAPYVVVTFSKPVDIATLVEDNFRVLTTAGFVPSNPRLADTSGTMVSLQFAAPAGSLATIYVNPGVRDFSGNPAVPFRSTVRVAPAIGQVAATVAMQRPSRYLDTIAPETVFTYMYTAPLDRASVERGFLVSVNGRIISGSFDWSPDSSAFSFTPASLLPAGAAVQVALVPPAKDAAGFDLTDNRRLTVASPPPTSPTGGASVRPPVSVFFRSWPLDAVVDLEFDRDVSAAVLAPGAARFTPPSVTPTPPAIGASATLLSPRVVRFRPDSTLQANWTYTFQLTAPGFQYSIFITTGAKTSRANPSVVAAAPSGDSVPLNARVVVAFSSIASELALPAGIVLLAGAAAVPLDASWSESHQAVTLTPRRLLAPNTTYTVSLSGFYDLSGNAIPGRTWSFRTGTVVDLVPPTLMRSEPLGEEVGPGAVPSVTFSEPVTGDLLDSFRVTAVAGANASSSAAISGTARMSDDARTIFFVPDAPLPASATVTVGAPTLSDFAGNGITSAGACFCFTFRVGFRTAGAPAVVDSTPDDGAAGLPLNVQFQARFDQPVLGTSLDGVALYENGAPVAITARVEADGRTVTALPKQLPAAGAAYRFVVAGVRNADGAAMADSRETNVTLGTYVDGAAPLMQSAALSGVAVPVGSPVRLRFSEAVNRLTVNERNISLARLGQFAGTQPGEAVTVKLEADARTVTITPVVPFAPYLTYSLTVSGVSDLAGNKMGQDYSSFAPQFTTAPSTPAATLAAVDPPDGSRNVPPSVSIQALFSAAVDLGDDPVRLWLGDRRIRGSVSMTGWVVKFNVAENLPDGDYRLEIVGVMDVTGGPLGPFQTTFSVTSGQSSGAPRLVSSTPATSSVGVPVASPIVLNFSTPVSAVMARQLTVTSLQGVPIFGNYNTQGSTITFTPIAPFPGATTFTVSGAVQSLDGLRVNVLMQFTTGANPDTTPPTLESVSPPDGSRLSWPGTVVLRFSEPISTSLGFRVLAGSNPFDPRVSIAEDGRTVFVTLYPPADADLLLGPTSALKDFAGNVAQPFTLHYHSTTDAENRPPRVSSVSPPDGAVNVDAAAPVVVTFTHAMDPTSVVGAIHVTDSGVSVAGAAAGDESGATFTFRPDAPLRPGAVADTFVENSAYDVLGRRGDAFHSRYTVAGPATQAVAYYASTEGIDVRWDGARPENACAAYLRRGQTLIATRCDPVAPDQIRLVPAAPLEVRGEYRLVISATQEIAIAPAEGGGEDAPEVDAAEGGIRLRFARPVNPIEWMRRVRLVRADGTRAPYSMRRSADGVELLLVVGDPAARLLRMTPSLNVSAPSPPR